MKVTIPDRAPALQNSPRTLAIDVGCTGLKASVLDQVDKIPPTGFVSSHFIRVGRKS